MIEGVGLCYKLGMKGREYLLLHGHVTLRALQYGRDLCSMRCSGSR